ncbi:MAG TPA: hypothetical protein VMT16_16690 [Thermoanaerobaculia bacterium]|nr:hypothetical protein [Thermoanaerobaculia bacterium]
MLVVRDVLTFHLPLRTAFRALLADGLPEWNPWLHGGQPILGNPNYAAFYPPTWLALPLPPPQALGLLALAHALLAYAGAWRLLRRLGAEPAAAGLGASGFAAGGFFLSLTSTFNLLCGTAWLPWVVVAALPLLDPEERPRGASLTAVAATAAVLAMQLLAGEPVAVLLSGLALAAVASTRPRLWRRSLPPLAGAAVLAALLAAAQLLPTVAHLQGSPRAGGLAVDTATTWSARPARLLELVYPRLWGDPTRDEEGLYFGWGIHDRDFPYVVSLHSGLLSAVLALAALLAWQVPLRRGLLLAAAAGALLGFGRHTPLYELLREHLPLLAMIRYPEKFLVLTAAVVPLAGALGWQALLAARRRGEVERTSLPIALALAAAVPPAAALATLLWRPEAGEEFVRQHSGLPPSPATVARGIEYLRQEAAVALALAAGVVLLLALLRRRRIPERLLSGAALLLLLLDLAYYGHRLNPTLPRGEILAPPPLALEAAAGAGRVFSSARLDDRPEIALRQGPPGLSQLWTRVRRLDPWAGILFGLAYGPQEDYDLMLTDWGRWSLGSLRRAWPRPQELMPLLGAWNVSTLVLRTSPEELLAALRRGETPPGPARAVPNPEVLPRYRFVAVTGEVAGRRAARGWLAAAGNRVADADACIAPGAPASRVALPGPAALVEVAERGKRIHLRYRAAGPAFLVAAVTFDRRWTATLEDGTAVPLCPTTLGQIGLVVPPGERVVTLLYRDPWVRIGAALSATALLLLLLVLRRRRASS